MKPSAWRASATFIILVYLYVLAVQEILGEEVVPAGPVVSQEEYVRTHHKLEGKEDTGEQTQFVRGSAYEASVCNKYFFIHLPLL